MSDLIGIATWNFAEGTLAERIDRFAAMGYNAVSLIGSDGAALGRGEMPDVEEAIARHGLAVTIHAAFSPRRELLPSEQLLADFRLFTEWHARTGALVSVNYDAAWAQDKDGTWQRQTKLMRALLGEMLYISDGAGFSVGVEDWPLDAEQAAEVEELRSYSHYGILIDLGHLNMRIREPDTPDYPFPAEIAGEHLARIDVPVNELHVHNNSGRKDMHAPPTSGTSDMALLADMLVDKGVDCISTIELVPGWCGLTEEEGWVAAKEALGFWRKSFMEK